MAVTEVGTANFTELVIESPIPVVVHFYADWCHPCHQIEPEIEELSKKWEGKLRFVKLDIDELAPLASAFGVSSIPTVLLIEGDHVVGRSLGAKSASQLEVDLDLSSLIRGAA